jgi:hypothetical protein
LALQLLQARPLRQPFRNRQQRNTVLRSYHTDRFSSWWSTRRGVISIMLVWPAWKVGAFCVCIFSHFHFF